MNIDDFNQGQFFAPANTISKIQKHYLKYFPEHGSVLDLGCGEGLFLELLKTSGRKGIGVDSSSRSIAHCKANGLEAVHMDVMEFLQSNEIKFDGIFASHLIEHFNPQDVLKLIQMMEKSLKPAGVLILITPCYYDILVSNERFWLDITQCSSISTKTP